MSQEIDNSTKLHRTNQSFSSDPIYEKRSAISRLFQIAKTENIFAKIPSANNSEGLAFNDEIEFQLFERHWWKSHEESEYYYKWKFYIVDHFDEEKGSNIIGFMRDSSTRWNNLFKYLQVEVGGVALSKSIKWLQSNCLSRENMTENFDFDILHHHLLIVYSNIFMTGVLLADIWQDYYRDEAKSDFLNKNGSPPAFLVKLNKKDASGFPPFQYLALGEAASDFDFNFSEEHIQSKTSYHETAETDQILESVQKLFEEYLYPLFYDEEFTADHFTTTVKVLDDLHIIGFLFFPIYEFLLGNKLYGAHLGWVQIIITGRGERTTSDDNHFPVDLSIETIKALSTACETFQIHLHECLTDKLLYGIETDILKEELEPNCSAKEFLSRHIYLLGGWKYDKSNTRIPVSNDKPCQIDDDGNAFIDFAYQWPPSLDKDGNNVSDILFLNRKAYTLVPNLILRLGKAREEIETTMFRRYAHFLARTNDIINRLAAERINIGHREPANLETIINTYNISRRRLIKNIDSLRSSLKELLKECGDPSSIGIVGNIPSILDDVSKDFEGALSPKINLLYLTISLQQNSLPPWITYEERCKCDDLKSILKLSVIEEIWEQIAAPVGQSNIRQKDNGEEVDKCFDDALKKDIRLTVNENRPIVFYNYMCLRAILSLLIIHLIEAYQHTLLGSMKSIVTNMDYTFNPEVTIEISKNNFAILNPVFLKGGESAEGILQKFTRGKQKREIDKILSLARGILSLNPTFPVVSDINKKSWRMKYKWSV